MKQFLIIFIGLISSAIAESNLNLDFLTKSPEVIVTECENFVEQDAVSIYRVTVDLLDGSELSKCASSVSYGPFTKASEAIAKSLSAYEYDKYEFTVRDKPSCMKFSNPITSEWSVILVHGPRNSIVCRLPNPSFGWNVEGTFRMGMGIIFDHNCTSSMVQKYKDQNN